MISLRYKLVLDKKFVVISSPTKYQTFSVARKQYLQYRILKRGSKRELCVCECACTFLPCTDYLPADSWPLLTQSGWPRHLEPLHSAVALRPITLHKFPKCRVQDSLTSTLEPNNFKVPNHLNLIRLAGGRLVKERYFHELIQTLLVIDQVYPSKNVCVVYFEPENSSLCAINQKTTGLVWTVFTTISVQTKQHHLQKVKLQTNLLLIESSNLLETRANTSVPRPV